MHPHGRKIRHIFGKFQETTMEEGRSKKVGGILVSNKEK